MTIYTLSETQHNHLKEQILITVNKKVTRIIERSQVIYKTRYLKRILQSLH